MPSTLFLYIWIGLDAGQRGRQPGRRLHHPLAGLVEQHPVQRVGDLRRGELRVRVVDVQPGAVGQDDVGRADVVDVGFRGAEQRGQVVPAGVPQRRLHLVVPARPAGPRRGHRRRVGQHHLGGGDHRVHPRLAGHRDAVLDLGAHDATHSHTSNLVRQDQGAWTPHRPTVTRLPTADQRLVRARCGSGGCSAITGSRRWRDRPLSELLAIDRGVLVQASRSPSRPAVLGAGRVVAQLAVADLGADHRVPDRPADRAGIDPGRRRRRSSRSSSASWWRSGWAG